MIDWTVEVRDITRARVGQVSEHDLTDFLCVPVANGVGTWSLSLPDTVVDVSGRRVPHRLCEALRQEGAGLILTGPGGYTVTGQTTFAEKTQSSSEPDGVWQIEGVTDAVELAQALAYPQPSNADPTSQAVSNDVRSAPAETLMRAFVNVNIGPGAPVARRVSGLTLAADQGRGPSLQKSPRFQNLLTLLQEIATGSDLLFDVVQVGTNLEFRVDERRDVSAMVRWDVENNQLEQSVYGWTMPGLTRAIVAGGGEGVGRKIVEVTTAESLAREATWGRVERFIDQRQTTDTTELQQAGLEALAEEGITSTGLRVKPSARIARGFGTDWRLGDYVTVVVGGVEIVAPVSETPIQISRDGVFVGAVLGDSTGSSPEAILSARQSRADQRISALERNAESGLYIPRTSFVPSWVNWSNPGNSTYQAYYTVSGGVAHFEVTITFGSTAGAWGDLGVSFGSTGLSRATMGVDAAVGTCVSFDVSASITVPGIVRASPGTPDAVWMRAIRADSTAATSYSLGAAFTPATGDTVFATWSFQIA